ncbi:hypothetical protein [Mammaliicoccus sciuri]|uniref:hypothetical protein n=1 Tax=Mammaliicoccus sciuri TaxID=1296 RepID=UPI002174F97B|nr:hypothetical protein [Mammaliicoccus sciuri]
MAIKRLIVLFCIFIVVVVSVMLFISNERDNDRDVRNFTSKNGTEGEYLIYPVKDAKGILVWLHGDGAYEFHHPDSEVYLAGKDGIRQVAKEKGLTLVVPKSVNDEEQWWKNGEANVQYLVELISSLPNHEKLWIGSFSGGAETTAYWMLDKLPELNVQSGGAIMFGGGGSPKKEGIATHIEKSQHVKGSFPLTWIVGENDHVGGKTEDDPFDAFATSKEGKAFYAQDGWVTKRVVLKHYSHILANGEVGLYGKYLREYID